MRNKKKTVPSAELVANNLEWVPFESKMGQKAPNSMSCERLVI